MAPRDIFHPDFKPQPYWWEAYTPASGELVPVPKSARVAIVGGGYAGLVGGARIVEARHRRRRASSAARSAPEVVVLVRLQARRIAGVGLGAEILDDDLLDVVLSIQGAQRIGCPSIRSGRVSPMPIEIDGGPAPAPPAGSMQVEPPGRAIRASRNAQGRQLLRLAAPGARSSMIPIDTGRAT